MTKFYNESFAKMYLSHTFLQEELYTMEYDTYHWTELDTVTIKSVTSFSVGLNRYKHLSFANCKMALNKIGTVSSSSVFLLSSTRITLHTLEKLAESLFIWDKI